LSESFFSGDHWLLGGVGDHCRSLRFTNGTYRFATAR
jgi:hypothetical protein